MGEHKKNNKNSVIISRETGIHLQETRPWDSLTALSGQLLSILEVDKY